MAGSRYAVLDDPDGKYLDIICDPSSIHQVLLSPILIGRSRMLVFDTDWTGPT